MVSPVRESQRKVHVRPRQIICHSSSRCSTPLCTGLTEALLGPLSKPSPVHARTLLCYFFSLLLFFSNSTWAGASRSLLAVVWVTRFSFLFLAAVVALHVSWGNKGKQRPPQCLFHIVWLHDMHFKFRIRECKNMRLFTEFAHILKQILLFKVKGNYHWQLRPALKSGVCQEYRGKWELMSVQLPKGFESLADIRIGWW